jgi:subtilisin-like proprotein convertase family protein
VSIFKNTVRLIFFSIVLLSKTFTSFSQQTQIAIATYDYNNGRCVWVGLPFLQEDSYTSGAIYSNSATTLLIDNIVTHTARSSSGSILLLNKNTSNVAQSALTTRLQNLGYTVTVSNTPSAYTTASSLQSFVAVIVSNPGNGQWSELDNASFCTALTTYVSNGGGVILTPYIPYNANNLPSYYTALQTISPFSSFSGYGLNLSYNLNLDAPSNPILNNIASVSVAPTTTDYALYPGTWVLKTNATVIATYTTYNPCPSAGTLSGTGSICVAGTSTLTTTGSTGGVWSSSNDAVAIVSTSGVVTGVAAGTATITYTIAANGSCNQSTANRTITVTAPPTSGTLSGTETVFVGAITAFVSTVTGGSWTSSSTSVATVNASTGVVTGVATGTATITYTVAGTGGCSNASATRAVTVYSCPTIAALSPSADRVCAGAAITLTAAGLAGVSSTSSGITFKFSTSSLADPYVGGTLIATVSNANLDASGSIARTTTTFNTGGTYYIYAILSPTPEGTGCRPFATTTLVVNPNGQVTRPANSVVCSGTSIAAQTLTTTNTGGTTTYAWTNNATSIGLAASGNTATIPAFIATNTGSSSVTATISVTPTYTEGGLSCAGTASSYSITVNPVPSLATITDRIVCNGSSNSINLAGTVNGSVYNWTNSNAQIGLAASGTGNISFTATNATSSPITSTILVTPEFSNPRGYTANSSPGGVEWCVIYDYEVSNGRYRVGIDLREFAGTGVSPSNVSQLQLFDLWNGPVTFASSDIYWANYYVYTNTQFNFSGSAYSANLRAANGFYGVSAEFGFTNPPVTCTGTPISFTVTVNPSGQVNTVSNQVLCVGSPTTAVNFTTANTTTSTLGTQNATSGTISVAIPDNSAAGITSTLSVNLPTGAIITGMRVTLNVTHTWISDMVINLRAPNGQVLNLFNAHGGSGDNLTNSVVSSAGTATFASGTPPYTGTFAATGASGVGPTGFTSNATNFASLYSTPSGNWSLALRDLALDDFGTLTNWSLSFDYEIPVAYTTYNWVNSNTGVGLAASGTGNIASFTATNAGSTPLTSTITVTPVYTNSGTNCAGTPSTFTYTVNPRVTVDTITNKTFCANALSSVAFTGNATGTTYSWTNSNTAIGLAASGNGDLSFVATNNTAGPISGTVTVTPSFTNGGLTCTGATRTFVIIINPLGQVNAVSSQVICNNASTTAVNFSTVNGGGTVIAGTPVVANSGTLALVVPDGAADGTSHTLPVALPAGATITDVRVNFNMTHTWVSDMSINLKAPNGQILNLVNRRGGSGDNFTNTTISSASTTALTSSSAPFTGTFAADAALNVGPTGQASTATNFAALYSVGTGNWTLWMRDHAAGDIGTLTNWSITINYTTVQGAVTSYTWTNNLPSIGLAASGTGNIASFAALNTSAVPVTATVNVTPTYTNNGVSCAGSPISFTYTVNPTPTVNAVSNQTVCRGSNTAAVTFTGATTGTVYNWTNSNTAIGLAASGTGNIPSFAGTNTSTAAITGTITVTPVYTNAGVTCTGTPRTFTITVNPIPTVNSVANFPVCHNSVASTTFSGASAGTIFSWTNSNPAIGLAGSGTGNISFTAINTTSAPVTATITVTPSFVNGGTTCVGTSTSFVITVNPLPVVTTGTLPARVCISDTLVRLNGTPAGGSWSGFGISGYNFVPPAIALGTWPITYTYADANGCVNSASTTVSVQACAERDRNLENDAVVLYPNPSNGKFNLRINSTLFNTLGMRVYKSNGQLMYVNQWRSLVFGRVIPVDLSRFAAGVYMIRLYYGDGMDRGADRTFKIIISQ